MVNVGNRPIIWHLMKYYAHFGHKDFVLCLGHQAEYIKNYFLKYDECVSNDFVLTDGGAKLDLIHRDIQDWRITFTDTGAQHQYRWAAAQRSAVRSSMRTCFSPTTPTISATSTSTR